jgi:PBSX family phage portal protein
MASDKQAKAEAFTFGEPVPMMDKREIMDYLYCTQLSKWYEPPIDPGALAKTFRTTPYLSSPMYFKVNILTSSFKPHRLLSRLDFRNFALNFIWGGNAYMERQQNRLGGTLKLKHALSKYMRRGLDMETYYWVPGYNQEHEFEKGSIFHLIEPDINQEIYGIPEYIPALNSAWLNEAATLFRRKYYLNGSHAGFILYINDTAQTDDDIDNIRTALKDSKGIGNFKNMFLYAPNGKKDGIQVIPLSEVAAKDDFSNITDATVEAMQYTSRVPPQLMGQTPRSQSSFGEPEKAAMVFSRNELIPLQSRFEELNEWLGEEVISFDPYTIEKAEEDSRGMR